jgi:large subunit ribosomal protein L31
VVLHTGPLPAYTFARFQESAAMKPKIHPKYYPNCKVFHNGELVMTCGATVPELHVEVWSGSHPFFTGKVSYVDSAGRIEKFQRKFGGNYFAKGDAAKPAAAKPTAAATPAAPATQS